MREIQTDIAILGSGGAGLMAALHAHATAPDLHITIVVKGLLGKCGCTRMVQGGYNVALSPDDSIERHFMDTIEGGKWINNQKLAWKLVTGAVETIHELEEVHGCLFDRNPDGSVHQKAFAGQSFDRTVHKGDLTGIEIVNRLSEQTLARDLHKLEEHRAIALIPTADGGAMAGVLLIDMRTGDFVLLRAKAVLLATGGGPTMYRYHTPSGDKSCDGLAMALDLGLGLRDMEMVQFHPTGLLAGTDTRMTGTVLEEGLRGAGGYLLDGDGNRFMAKYDAKAERATRDIVSRAMYAEMQAGAVSPNGGLFIDMRHIGTDKVRRQFKGMVKRCADCGFDLAAGLVEVVPTAHYMMGGLLFNDDTSTEIRGLFAAGEDTGGVHGANRLGGNGVANSTVFGRIAGRRMAAFAAANAVLSDPDLSLAEAAAAQCLKPFELAPGDVNRIRDDLYDLMWSKAGIIRDRNGLTAALDGLQDLDRRLECCGIADRNRVFNLTWHDWLNLRSLIVVSRAIVHAAVARDDSRGAHYRRDYPEAGALEETCYSLIRRRAGHFEIEMPPVEFTIVKPGQTLLRQTEKEAMA